MNVASLSLCKALYEVSTWRGSEFWWYRVGNEWYSDAYKGEFPAYDLGCLLRKLPGFSMNGGKVGVKILDRSSQPFSIWYKGFNGSADTPEDAACKLAIELFKQKILTKEKN